MSWFVQPDSIVRRIWGDADVVLLIFAGAAAEFALNRAVDWLFFTGNLPADPLGRLFSTAAYAQEIVFAEQEQAERTLKRIRAIHQAVEKQRGEYIPDWAHRDVLYLLVDYSERAYRAFHCPLTPAEQQELFEVFLRVGNGLGIPDLPQDYESWTVDRQHHLEQDLAFSPHTQALYAAYRRALGALRYALILQFQVMVVPERVRQLLSLPRRSWLTPLVPLYSMSIRLGLRSLVHRVLIPPQHFDAVERMQVPVSQ